MTNVRVDQVTHNSIRVRWTKPAESSTAPITRYTIFTRTRNAADTGWGGWIRRDDVRPGSATSHTQTGLPSDVRQEVRISARADRSGNPTLYGPNSAEVEFTTAAANAPGAPGAPTVNATADSHTSLDVSWSAPTNSGPAITSYDLQYRAGTSGSFTAGPQDVTGTSATIGSLEEGTSYQVQVRATNAVGNSGWSDAGTGATTVRPNNAPDFASDTAMRSFAENTAAGTDIGAPLTATDADEGDTLTYSLSGSDAASFYIVAESGQLRAWSGVSYDFESRSSYTVTVEVSDGTDTDTIAVTIALTDIDEPPARPVPTFGTTTATSVVVNWQKPANTGPDIDDYDVQYRLASTAPSGAWTSHPHVGTATTTTIGSLQAGQSYQVQVSAANDEGTGGWSEPRTATAAANSAPAFAVGSYSFTLAENAGGSTTAVDVGTVSANDADSGDTVSYRIAAGNTGGVFAIASNGAITYTGGGENFEGFTDPANAFTLTVRARDDHNASADIAVTVAVTDVEGEAPAAPAPPTFGDTTSTSIVVNWLAPANTGPAITDYDVWYREEGTSGSFTGHFHSGPARTTTLMGLTPGTAYEVQVRATNAEGMSGWSDSGIGTAAVAANDAPAFARDSYRFTLAENADGSTDAVDVGGVSATDVDTGDTVSYRIASGNTGGVFAIASDGAITYTGSGENHETTPGFTLTVRARDDHNASADATVTVAVTDVDEPPAAPAVPTFGTTTPTSLAVNWLKPANTGPGITDYDVQYRQGTSGPFTSHDHTGIGRTTTLTGLTSGQSYQVQVRAKNAEGTSGWSDPGTGTTTATTNNAPQFDQGSYRFTLTENADGSTNAVDVGMVSATDVDGHSVSYDIAAGDDGGVFAIASDGAITYTGSGENFETTPGFTLTVRASDGHNASADVTVTVSVTNVDGEAPAAPAAPTVSATADSTTSLDVSWTAPTDTGPDITDYDVQYRLASAAPLGVWTAHAHHGTDTATTIGSLRADTSYQVQVRAKNAEGTGDWSDPATWTTGLTANDAPEFDQDSYRFTLAENADGSTDALDVGTVSATDTDGHTVSYEIAAGNTGGVFAIGSSSGTIAYTGSGENFEGFADPASAFTLTVRARDSHAGSADVRVTVRVTDVDPVLSSATITGATLVLAYDEGLDEDSVPGRDAFTVEVNGGEVRLATRNAVAVSGRAVTVRLLSAVTHDDTVAVSYAAPSANPIRDPAGNRAANLSSREVTNKTVDTTAPALRSATITYEMLVMRYDEALDESSVPAASAFLVYVAGAPVSVEDVEVDGRAVRLTLASAAAHGDTGSVKYVAPSANPIRDPAGNKAENTAGHRVWTNNTPEPRDTTAPTLSSATVTNATLVLAYNEALDEDSVPATSAYTVRVAGSTVTVRNVAVDSAKVKLTLASAAAHGDAVTVSYTAPSANPIRDPAGNEAANLSSRAATNDTPAPSDTTAPTLSSATMTDNRIVLAFDEALDENSVPQASAFRALVDGGVLKKIDHVAVAGSAVTLEVRPSAVSCGGDWTVSYSVPGAYPLRDTSGNAAGGFSNRAVTMAPNTPGITVTAPSPSPMREGGTATFTVKLDAMPCWMVNIELSSDNPDVVAPHHRLLSFANVTGSGRWDRPQWVTVHSRQDHDAADETGTFTLRVRDDAPGEYTALPDVTVIVEVADDDEAALSVADASVAEEAGATLDFRVTIDRARHLPVTVDYATRDGTARAGQDYTATRGTLTFAAGEKSKTVAVPVLDDALDEGDETLVLTLSNASEAGIADGEATGTITNADPLQKMWLSRFGRTVAGHLTDAVSDRLAAPLTGAQVTVGGRRVDLAGRKDEAWLGETLTSLAQALGAEQETVPEGEGWPGSGLGVRESPAPVGSPARTVPGREVLLGSAFHLARAGDGGGAGLAAWGRVTAGGFDGAAPAETGDVSIDGDVTTGVLGADAEWDRLLAGVAVSVSEGEGTFDQPGVDSGTVESTMTTVSPYARMALTDRVSAWGLVGYGTGDMTIVQAANERGQPERVTRSDLGMRLAAVGGRGALLEAGETGGMDLALKTDAFFVQTESEAVSNEGTTTADASRVRLILEGTRAFDLGDGAVLTPGLELGLRHDGGDAETGAGVELGGRVSFAAAGSRLSMEASVRTLVAHEVSGYEEWGASGAIRLAPGASGRGLSVRLAPTWGAPSSGAERLWSARDARALSPDGTFEPEGRLEAELGYGHRVGGAFTGTPYAGLGLSGDARDWRIGWRLGSAGAKSGFSLHLEGTRSESANDDTAPEHAIRLELKARF